jgi:hypothetical protein
VEDNDAVPAGNGNQSNFCTQSMDRWGQRLPKHWKFDLSGGDGRRSWCRSREIGKLQTNHFLFRVIRENSCGLCLQPATITAPFSKRFL